MEKLEQGKGDWRIGGGIPSGVFLGMLLSVVQCCFNENFASHLRNRNRWASHESLVYFYHLDTVSHVADCVSFFALLLSLQPVLDIKIYIWSTDLSPGFISFFPLIFPLHFVSITYIFSWLVNSSCYIATCLCHALGEKYHVLATHSWGRFP